MTLNPKIAVIALWLASAAAHAQTCQTASIPATTPTDRFTVNANGTVNDQQTGLMWKQCSEGQSGANCATGSPASYTWPGALQQAQALNSGGGFAGFTDWRLPNTKELESIVERQCYEPAINAAVFPNTPNAGYWSSSPVVVSSYRAWDVYFSYGDDHWGDKGNSNYVRLVRSGQ